MPSPGRQDTHAAPKDAWVRRVVTGVLLAFVVALFAFQAALIKTRTFDPDEFQHAHSAFLISEGQLPYRDYFEHHPPLLHFLLAPVLALLHPEQGGTRALDALVALRGIGAAFAILGAVAHFLVARRLLGSIGAAAASLLLWSTLIVFEKAIEIRPDTQAFAILQIVLLFLVRSASTRTVAVAFSLLGVGLLFTQKLAFPALGLMAVVWLRTTPLARERWRVSGAIIAGLVGPTLLCASYFASQSALPQFIENVFAINLRWKARLAAWPFMLERFVGPSPFFAVLASLGLLRTLVTLRLVNLSERRSKLPVVASALGGLAGLALLPVAWEQYYLLFLPQLAILGSGALLDFVAWLSRSAPGAAVVTLPSALVILAGLYPSREAVLNQRLRLAEPKQRAIALILDNSAPEDTVLDGYSGIGVFRPHAYRYFFLHAEMRLMLEGRVGDLEKGLENGSIAPRFASGDSQLSAVSPRVRSFIASNFAPAGEEPVLVRVFPGGPVGWDDTEVRYFGGPPPTRGPYLLGVTGWSDVRTVQGRRARLSRGKSSSVLFPVLVHDRVTRVRLSARAGADVPGLVARVLLNGRDLGEVALDLSFRTFELTVPRDVLIPGLNRLEFFYPRRPVQLDATISDPRHNEALLLESLALALDDGGPEISPPKKTRP